MTTYPYCSLAQIRENFIAVYPGLDIKFYAIAHTDHQGSRTEDVLDNELIISALSDHSSSTIVDINPQKTVQELEEAFKKRLGLTI